MYAVIETGGKQYRVEVGTELEVELLDAAPGDAITIDRVLLVGDGDESAIGQPVVADAAVSAEVVRQTRGEKLISFKYRPKARSRVKKGHRQDLMLLRITDVRLGKKSAAEAARKADADAKTERQRLEEAAARQAAADAELAAKLAKSTEAKATAAEKPKRGEKAAAGGAAPGTSTAEAKADTPPKRSAGSRSSAKVSPADAGSADKAKPAPTKPAPKKSTRAKKDE